MYRKKDGGTYYVNVRWRGYPRLQLSTGTSNKRRAEAVQTTLQRLRDAGRRDIIVLLSEKKLTLPDVHEIYLRDPAALDQRIVRATSHILGPLVEEWIAWLRSPAAISTKTRRPYAPGTVDRYEQSWERFFALLGRGRNARAGDLTKGFLVEYQSQRKRAGRTGATVNRDMVALTAFWRWAQEERGLAIPLPKTIKERESTGRERWLDATERAALERATPQEWWPLLSTLLYTGMRIGEAQGLRWADVRLNERRIHVHDRTRRLKNKSANRMLPIAEPLAKVIGLHSARVDTSPSALVFPGDFGDRHAAYRVFMRACKLAKIEGATLHDCRHSFAVHAVQGGIPISRLQKLLGHSTPAMSLRYSAHAPGAYLDGDAAIIAAGFEGAPANEADTRATIARTSLKRA